MKTTITKNCTDMEQHNKLKKRSCKRGNLNSGYFASGAFPSPPCPLLPTHRLKHPPFHFPPEGEQILQYFPAVVRSYWHKESH